MDIEQIKDALMILKNIDCCSMNCEECPISTIEKVVLENGNTYDCFADALDDLLKCD